MQQLKLMSRVTLAFTACCFAASGAAIDRQEPTVVSEISEQASKIDTQTEEEEKSKSSGDIACDELESL